MRTLKFVFTAGVAHAGVTLELHRSPTAIPKSAGATTPISGSA
jgi:hypothetical protein